MRIEEIDKNFLPPSLPAGVELEYFSVREAPFKVWGLMDEGDTFRRLPVSVAKASNSGVEFLGEHSAGGRVTFRTDSRCVAISVKTYNVARFAHFPTCGASGFDLYEDNRTFLGSYLPPYLVEDGYGRVITGLGDKKMRNLMLNWPLYTAVSELYIGIEKGAKLEAYNPYLDIPPIVYYGSSITQGGCACRPGNAYQAKISRELSVDHINLGFSGSARGEDAMAEHIASLPMSVFVMDYDHNAPSAEHLRNTHERFYKIIREKNPDLPIVFVTAPDIGYRISYGKVDSFSERRAIIMENYARLRAAGDQNLYFIDGASFYQATDADYCTVDGCHPNDLGFYRMAIGMMPTLKRILGL